MPPFPIHLLGSIRPVSALAPWPIELTIYGAPASKKNSVELLVNRKTGRFSKRESARYRRWEEFAVQQLRLVWARRAKIAEPVRLSCMFLEHPAQRGDLPGMLQGVCDALQRGGVLANDRLVRGTGRLDILRDPDMPRAVIILEPMNPGATP